MVLFILIIQGCDKGLEIQDNTEFENPMNFVGQYHNKGLEYILQNYNNCELNIKSFQDTVDRIIFLLNDFVKTIPPGSILSYNKTEYKDFRDILLKKLFDPDANKIKSGARQLTETQKSYVDRIKSLLQNQNESDSLMVFKRVSKLENEIWKSEMPEKEKYTILVAASVGKYSWKFWSQEKFRKTYEAQSKGTNVKDTPWQRLKAAVLEADIDGAIIGMVGGCIGGAIIGTMIMPGVGSLTGCMLEAVSAGFQGAVIASTLGAVKYLIFD